MKDWQQKAEQLKRETVALSLASRHPQTPWYAKLLVVGLVAYALSPIDLIPDPIPILGYLDDLVLIPLGIVLARKMIPDEVLVECRSKAQETLDQDGPARWAVTAAIIAIWVLVAVLLITGLFHTFHELAAPSG
ncbi:MAG: YkvA family protein [Anaerolineae bacterium]|jgi:uncharacterized membrane protein YkvA (DUF1232 family)